MAAQGLRRARGWHRWLALVVGIQAVIWTASGLYMTAVDIDTIHGDHLIRESAAPAIDPGTLGIDVAGIQARYGALTGLRLATVAGMPALVVETPRGRTVLDAATGGELPRPDEGRIRDIARALYAGDDPIRSVALIQEVPAEIRGRRPPLWRVEFDHWNRPTFYLSPQTGELVSRRHELWRWFDFLWMLHIMDYETRDDVNNPLLRIASAAGLTLGLAGLVLLVLRLRARGREDRA